jgi:hypothetical protein
VADIGRRGRASTRDAGASRIVEHRLRLVLLVVLVVGAALVLAVALGV